jgi:Putative zinc-finger
VNCDEVFRRLAEYLDGEVGGPLGDEMLGHLHACVPCDELRRDLEDLSRLSRQCPAPPLPEDLRRRIEAFLKSR